MGRLSSEDIRRIREKSVTGALTKEGIRKLQERFPRAMSTEIFHPAVNQALRAGGLALGAAAGAGIAYPLTAAQLLESPGDMPWFPDPSKIGQAFQAFTDPVESQIPMGEEQFWGERFASDLGQRVTKSQEELEAGPGYWGAAEAALEIPLLGFSKLLGKAITPRMGLPKDRFIPGTGGPISPEYLAGRTTRGPDEPLALPPWRGKEGVPFSPIPQGPTVPSRASDALLGLREQVGRQLQAPWDIEEELGSAALGAFGRYLRGAPLRVPAATSRAVADPLALPEGQFVEGQFVEDPLALPSGQRMDEPLALPSGQMADDPLALPSGPDDLLALPQGRFALPLGRGQEGVPSVGAVPEVSLADELGFKSLDQRLDDITDNIGGMISRQSSQEDMVAYFDEVMSGNPQLFKLKEMNPVIKQIEVIKRNPTAGPDEWLDVKTAIDEIAEKPEVVQRMAANLGMETPALRQVTPTAAQMQVVQEGVVPSASVDELERRLPILNNAIEEARVSMVRNRENGYTLSWSIDRTVRKNAIPPDFKEKVVTAFRESETEFGIGVKERSTESIMNTFWKRGINGDKSLLFHLRDLLNGINGVKVRAVKQGKELKDSENKFNELVEDRYGVLHDIGRLKGELGGELPTTPPPTVVPTTTTPTAAPTPTVVPRQVIPSAVVEEPSVAGVPVGPGRFLYERGRQPIPLQGRVGDIPEADGLSPNVKRRIEEKAGSGDGGPNEPPVPVSSGGYEGPLSQNLLAPLRDIGTVIMTSFQEADRTIKRVIQKFVSTAPGMRHTARHFHPAAVIKENDRFGKANAARLVLSVEGEQKAAAAIAHLRVLGTEKSIWGSIDEVGRLKGDTVDSLKLRGMALNDIRTRRTSPKIQALLNNRQKEWVNMAHQLEEAKLLMLQKAGIKVHLLSFGEGGEYAGRRAWALENKFGEVIEFGDIGGKKPRGKPGSQHKRHFEKEEQGIKAGIRYISETEALELNLRQAYETIVTKKFADWIKDPKNMPQVIKSGKGKVPKGDYTKDLGEILPYEFKGWKTDAETYKRMREAFFLEASDIATPTPGLRVSRTAGENFRALFSTAAGKVGQVQAVQRMVALGSDASSMTIHLLWLAGANPRAWAGGLEGFVKGLFDPLYLDNLKVRHRPLIDKHPDMLLSETGSEVVDAAQRGGLIFKYKLPRAVMEPFARAFNSSLDTAGIYLAKSLDETAMMNPRYLTPDEFAKRTADVDAFINNIRGLSSSKRLGVSPNIRLLENNMLLAPRYRRAVFSLLYDTIVDGGMRGDLSRKAMLRSVAGIGCALTAYTIIQYANESDNPTVEEMVKRVQDLWNPASSKFFTVSIGGQNIGPGTAVRSIIALLGKSIKDPKSLYELSQDNPFLRFGRSSAAPLVSDGWDILTGYDFLGNPTGLMSDYGTDISTAERFGHFVTNVAAPDMMPIFAQSVVLDTGTLGERFARAGVEWTGFRAYPETFFQEKERIAKEAVEEGILPADFETTWDEMSRREKQRLDILMKQRGIQKDYTFAKGKKQHYEKRDVINDTFIVDLGKIEESNLSLPITDSDRVPADARNELTALKEQRITDLHGGWNSQEQKRTGGIYSDIYDEEFEEPEDKDSTDHAVWRYYNLFDRYIDKDGKLDYDKLSEGEAKFWGSLTGEKIDAVLDEIRVMEDRYPEGVRQMQDAMRYTGTVKLDVRGHMTSYWDLEDHPLVLEELSKLSNRTKEDVIAYREMSSSKQDIEDYDPRQKDIGNAIDKAYGKNGIITTVQRDFLRDAPPEWTLAMYYSGYKYHKKKEVEQFMRDYVKAGGILPDVDYKQLYRQNIGNIALTK